MSNPHAEHSALRERITEHAFLADLCRELWRRGEYEMEVLRAEADTAGYDVVVTVREITRHIQLKAKTTDGSKNTWNISERLMEKPSGCVVILFVRREDLSTQEYAFLGAAPGEPLPDITGAPRAKHTKGDSFGVKSERKQHRKIGISKFERLASIAELTDKLFGTQLTFSP